MKLITAIYDKKAKTFGRPIFQDNIEKAISGVTDALNSMNTQGEYLMPAHREHPEDYCLMQLGYWDDEREIISFDAETGKYTFTPKTTPVIQIEEKIVCEFKDLEIKEMQSKISAEQVYKLIDEMRKDTNETLGQAFERFKNELEEMHIRQGINPKKKGFWLCKFGKQ